MWLRFGGCVAVVATGALAVRVGWEQTVWSWERGPQMVGFSLAHGGGFFLLFAPYWSLAWLLVVAVVSIRQAVRGLRVSFGRLVGLFFCAMVLVASNLSSGVWQWLFIDKFASSRYAVDFLQLDAFHGDTAGVGRLASRGISVNRHDRHTGRTALHAAAYGGSLKMIRYLLSNGAEINALNNDGDSPLDVAIATGHADAAQLLRDHGGARTHGSDADRQK